MSVHTRRLLLAGILCLLQKATGTTGATTIASTTTGSTVTSPTTTSSAAPSSTGSSSSSSAPSTTLSPTPDTSTDTSVTPAPSTTVSVTPAHSSSSSGPSVPGTGSPTTSSTSPESSTTPVTGNGPSTTPATGNGPSTTPATGNGPSTTPATGNGPSTTPATGNGPSASGSSNPSLTPTATTAAPNQCYNHTCDGKNCLSNAINNGTATKCDRNGGYCWIGTTEKDSSFKIETKCFSHSCNYDEMESGIGKRKTNCCNAHLCNVVDILKGAATTPQSSALPFIAVVFAALVMRF